MSVSHVEKGSPPSADGVNCFQKFGASLQAPMCKAIEKRKREESCLLKTAFTVLVVVLSPLALIGKIFSKLATLCSFSLAKKEQGSAGGVPHNECSTEELYQEIESKIEAYKHAFIEAKNKGDTTEDAGQIGKEIPALMAKLPKDFPRADDDAALDFAMTLVMFASLPSNYPEPYDTRFVESSRLISRMKEDETLFDRLKDRIVRYCMAWGERTSAAILECVNQWLKNQGLPTINMKDWLDGKFG